MGELSRFRNVVNGQAVESATGRWIASVDPYRGDAWAEVPQCNASDTSAAIEAAHKAFVKGPWASMSATNRGKLLRRLGDLIARDAEKLGKGWFVQPTIFGDVSNSMRIAREEVFGPILSIIPFDDDEEAIEIANDTIYGLASGVWTWNIRRAFTMADRIRAGTVWVNTYRAVSFMAPFGGYKMSGIGRESGQAAINEYLQTKSVWINLAEGVANPFVMH